MNRRVLLIEPNYKNKYPPLGLMKISRYFRQICGDNVRFFKGDLKKFAAQLLTEEFFNETDDFQSTALFGRYSDSLDNFIKAGKYSYLDNIPKLRGSLLEEKLTNLRRRFKQDDYPKFDIICVSTLFTFFWTETIDTINFAKKFLAPSGKIYVGGIAATLVPDAMYSEVGNDDVKILPGLLNKLNDFDKLDDVIIDTLPPDYSIIEEIDYKYPASNAYFGYTTRGCIRQCAFCAVHTLEPDYKNYVDIRSQLEQVEEQFGTKQYLLLMDNNVLASPNFPKIIDDIKSCGFEKGATYIPSNEYEIAIKNLRNGYNERAYVKKIILLYEELDKILSEEEAGEFYSMRESKNLLYYVSATRDKILEFDSVARLLFKKYHRRNKRARYIDFNQGLDARLITEENMAKLAEINIRPLRIAFDHYEQREIYSRAIRIAAKHGIRNMSNYLLYNFYDTPDDLYMRLKLNIELCEELNVSIYSFPMKYHPIRDPEYFRNRDYLGVHWNKKFIRAIQAIINATKGKIGRGRSFFEEAFGKNLDEFHDLLWMPEAMIIYRFKYKENLAKEWRKAFHTLNESELNEAMEIITRNKFTDDNLSKANSEKVRQFLAFYQISRH